jgi:hypothetical protein
MKNFKIDRPSQWSRYTQLFEMLKDTDYKVVKCFEAFMAKEPMPYDFEELKAQRQAWRDEIAKLEQENAI